MIEYTAQERAFVMGVFSAGGFAGGEFAGFAQLRAEKNTARAQFEDLATGEEKASLKFVLGTGAASMTDTFEQVALDADGHHIVVPPRGWWSALTSVLADLDHLQRHIASQALARLYDLHRKAQQQLSGLGVLAFLCLLKSAYQYRRLRRRSPPSGLRREPAPAAVGAYS